MEITQGIYIGKATENGGLVLHLVRETGKKIGFSEKEKMDNELPYSESGFCSQEEIENFKKC